MAKLKLKSKFEYDVAKWLRSVKQKVRYEEIRIKYAVIRHRYYTPDFILNNGIIIEAKGWLRPSDRTKHLLIKEQYPDLDIRFLFQNANNLLRKGSKPRYCDWCDKHGFLYAHKEIPKQWLTERKKRIKL